MRYARSRLPFKTMGMPEWKAINPSNQNSMDRPKRFYAQNFEDLYLYRIFSNIDNGFYIDAGAWDPVKDSVTKVFYDNGWQGVNIEPLEECYNSLARHRPRDTNLCAAVIEDQSVRTVELTVIGDSPRDYGIHFLSDQENNVDKDSIKRLYGNTSTRPVLATTLREVVDNYARPRKINFLKLDIEGSEFRALAGLNLPTLSEELKPEIILLEATLPNTRLSAPHRAQCKELLLGNGYRQLFFDGLNDYYCRSEMLASFTDLMLPPNVFDSIIASTLFYQAESYLAAQEELAEIRAYCRDLEARLCRLARSQGSIINAINRVAKLAEATGDCTSLE